MSTVSVVRKLFRRLRPIRCECGMTFATEDEYAEHCGILVDHFTVRCLA